MARISKDDFKYCRVHNECFDCHSERIVKPAEVLQARGKFKVPSCRAHFNAYKRKSSQANAKKYLRSSEAKRRAGR